MKITSINIRNFRLIKDAKLELHEDVTVIVGKNNTAKTSLMELLQKIFFGKPLSFNDLPIDERQGLFEGVFRYWKGEIDYNELRKSIPKVGIDFLVDYKKELEDDSLGALSPFIIDIDENITEVVVCVEYRLKFDEESFRNKIKSLMVDGLDCKRQIINWCKQYFCSYLELVVCVKKNVGDGLDEIKSFTELTRLFPFYIIPAERSLGEDGEEGEGSLTNLINNYFTADLSKLEEGIADQVKELKDTVALLSDKLQTKSTEVLGQLIRNAVGFGYPNTEELQLGVQTNVKVENIIKDHTELTYSSSDSDGILPSRYNGLGYKNLIKIAFQLSEFSRIINNDNVNRVPLLFIEEPESHMHPQMQQLFASYLNEFLKKISGIQIQVVVTSHSAHVVNAVPFDRIRYAQKINSKIIYKNLNNFVTENKDNSEFIRKYLTLSRSDLFFADKMILIEGAAERLLIPDVIEKLARIKSIKPEGCLRNQYYTLIEVGGAYAYKFIPFAEFLDIPCLIITDIDPLGEDGKSSLVSAGVDTSNVTIKYWFGKMLHNKESTIDFKRIKSATDDVKTVGNCHIEYQTEENDICGKSLEEAIMNVNRKMYFDREEISENELKFKEKSKTDFAIKLVFNSEYEVPKYIKNGLVWLGMQCVNK